MIMDNDSYIVIMDIDFLIHMIVNGLLMDNDCYIVYNGIIYDNNCIVLRK